MGAGLFWICRGTARVSSSYMGSSPGGPTSGLVSSSPSPGPPLMPSHIIHEVRASAQECGRFPTTTESSAQHKATNSCAGQSQPLRITAEWRDPSTGRWGAEGRPGCWQIPQSSLPWCRTGGVLPMALFSASYFTWAKSEITFCSGKARH